MKFSGKTVEWSVIETEEYKPFHDFRENKINVIKIDFPETGFSYVVKIIDLIEKAPHLGPGMFLSTLPELGIGETEVGKCFYIRPKISSCIGSQITEVEVGRLNQWIFSSNFRFVESLSYNYKKQKSQ